jgi:hypothetical protein
VSGSRALPPRWLPQCSCVVIESSFDPGELFQAPGSLWFSRARQTCGTSHFIRPCTIVHATDFGLPPNFEDWYLYFKTITQTIRVLYTNPWSAVVFSRDRFPPHILGSHDIACSAMENTLYHAGYWKNTPTTCNGKCKKHAVPSVHPYYKI